MLRIATVGFRIGLVSCAIAACAAAAEPEANFWAPVNGPNQGPVKCLVPADGVVYAGTMNGVFTTKDSGRHWVRIPHAGMVDKIVTSIAVTPAGVFAAGCRDGTYGSVSRLSPDGASWTDISGNLRPKRVPFGVLSGLVFNAAGDLFVGTFPGLFRLPAGESTWEPVGNLKTVYCLVKDSKGRLFAGTDGAGVCYSTDEGKTWEKVSLGSRADTVFALTVDPLDRVWAGTRAGLWRSTDHGVTWKSLALADVPVSAVAVSGEQVFAGVSELRVHTVSYFGSLRRSTDGGATFKEITTGLEGLGQVWSVWVSGKTVLVGASGAYVSVDGGDTFQLANEGLEASNWVRDCAFKADGTVFASTPTGVYRSADRGRTWVRLVNGLGNLQCFRLVIASKDLPEGDKSGAVLVGVWAVGNGWNSSANGSARIYRSTDNGEHWTDSTPKWTYSNVGTKMRAMIENSRGEIFAGDQFTGNQGNLWRSTDSGRTFKPVAISQTNVGGLFSMAMNPAFPNEIYLSVEMGEKLFRSTDHGDTWVHPASAHYPQADPGGFGWTLDGKTMFAGNVHGNFYSTDKGESWVRSAVPGTFFDFATARDGTMYAADMYKGAWRSTDNGKSWQVLNSGMGTGTGTDANLWSQCIRIAPDGYLWIGTQDALYRSVQPVEPGPQGNR
jgi:photosystem II stability/assembly factor-like uncharacterized protein